jgi:hypothetical protein
MAKKDRIDRMEKVLQIYHKYFKKLGKVPFKHQISNEDLSKMDKLFINPVVARDCAFSGLDSSLAGWKNTELSINDYCQEKKKTIFTIPKKKSAKSSKKKAKKTPSKSKKRKAKKTTKGK